MPRTKPETVEARTARATAFGGSSLLPGDRVAVYGCYATVSTTYLVDSVWGKSRRYDVNLDSGEEMRGLNWCQLTPISPKH